MNPTSDPKPTAPDVETAPPADGSGASPLAPKDADVLAAETMEELRAERDALSEQIDANEEMHKGLVAQRRAIDAAIRNKNIDGVATELLGPVPDLAPVTGVKTPEETCPKISFLGRELPSKTVIYGFLCLLVGLFLFPLFGFVVFRTIMGIAQGSFDGENMVATIVFFMIYGALILICGAGFVLLGVRMLVDDKKNRLRLTNALILLMIAVFVSHLLVYGVGNMLVVYGFMLALLVLVHGYFEPLIALERYNEITDDKTLRQMLKKDDVERYTIPGKRPGKGYITLDFFNLFWIFTICSFLGLIIETIWHVTVVDPGVYQDRAGMLWGPLSPIYGFGGGLMTIFLNRLHDKPIWVTFIVSAIVGGAFEYFTSWYLQYAFGITAWDYSGTFLNIDGRTNFMFMCMWGVLGCVWVRLLLPIMLYFMKKIPWKWKYTLTAIFAVFVIFDGIMTTVTLDCWYLREDGVPVQGLVEDFCAEHFDNKFMEERFQSMTMNVDSAARSDAKIEHENPASSKV